MKLNRKDLKKIQYDFNRYSNRLLQADFQDYTETLGKFLSFIESTPLIYEYIRDCGACDWDMDDIVQKVQNSGGRNTFPLGNTDREEVRNVYATLRYLVDNDNPIYKKVALGYSSSSKYQDKIKGFNDRFASVLICHLEGYLTKAGIDMGLDEQSIYNVTVQNGQAIIANDNSTVKANANININDIELGELIAKIMETATALESSEDRETVEESIEVVGTEMTSEKPRKSMIKTALASLKAIKGTAEFGAAVATLVQFVEAIL